MYIYTCGSGLLVTLDLLDYSISVRAFCASRWRIVLKMEDAVLGIEDVGLVPEVADVEILVQDKSVGTLVVVR